MLQIRSKLCWQINLEAWARIKMWHKGGTLPELCTCMHVYMPGNGQDGEEVLKLHRKFPKIRIKMHCQGYEGNLAHRLPTLCLTWSP